VAARRPKGVEQARAAATVDADGAVAAIEFLERIAVRGERQMLQAVADSRLPRSAAATEIEAQGCSGERNQWRKDASYEVLGVLCANQLSG
jgi:hypothetical protein